MNADELLSYAKLTGIPLQLLQRAGAGDAAALSSLAGYQSRQLDSLTASLTDPRAYVRARALQGIDALRSGTAPVDIGTINYGGTGPVLNGIADPRFDRALHATDNAVDTGTVATGKRGFLVPALAIGLGFLLFGRKR